MVESNTVAGKSVLAQFLRICFIVTFGLVSSIAAVACAGLLVLPEALLAARRRKSAAAQGENSVMHSLSKTVAVSSVTPAGVSLFVDAW